MASASKGCAETTESENLLNANRDSLLNDVTWQIVHQVVSDVVRVRVQRCYPVYLSIIDVTISASVADYVTVLIDSHHSSPAGDVYPARQKLATPRRARSNETFVVVSHQSFEVGVTDLRYNNNNNNNNNKIK